MFCLFIQNTATVMPTGNTPHVAVLMLMPIDQEQKYDKACGSDFSKGQNKSLWVLWVIDHNSHVAYGWTHYCIRKINIITDHSK